MNCQPLESRKPPALAQAMALCAQQGWRLTPTRQTVLELIWNSDQPMKAYDILDALRQTEHSAKPPTVYRALDFLLRHHLIHKLHTLNAYIGCHQPSHDSHCVFFICSACQHITEHRADNYRQLVESASQSIQFTPHQTSLEIHGLCHQCAA